MGEREELLALAERLRQSLAEDRHQEMQMVMNRVATALEGWGASAHAQSSWQPIETAPKDGTEVLCFVEGFGMGQMVLYWMDGYWREKANCLGLKKEPTFWQHTPTPPIPSTDGKGGAS